MLKLSNLKVNNTLNSVCMRHFLYFWLVISQTNLFAQSEDLLFVERRKLYNHWKESLDQKSGFLGNQNKADVLEINEVLKHFNYV